MYIKFSKLHAPYKFKLNQIYDREMEGPITVATKRDRNGMNQGSDKKRKKKKTKSRSERWYNIASSDRYKLQENYGMMISQGIKFLTVSSSLRSHPVDLVQSRLQDVEQHPRNSRCHHKQQKLPPVVTRGFGDRRHFSGSGMRRRRRHESGQAAETQPDDESFGAAHAVDLVERRLKNVEEHPPYGRDYGQQQGQAAVVAFRYVRYLLRGEGGVAGSEGREYGSGDGCGKGEVGGFGWGGDEALGKRKERRFWGCEFGGEFWRCGVEAFGVDHGHCWYCCCHCWVEWVSAWWWCVWCGRGKMGNVVLSEKWQFSVWKSHVGETRSNGVPLSRFFSYPNRDLD